MDAVRASARAEPDAAPQRLRTRKYRETHRRALRHPCEEAGVTGVPMFVIGDRVLPGLQDRETLEAVIEEELARRTARREERCRLGLFV
jgi:predicted DsbA family dithiol-disulfide isomerase